MQRRTLLRAAPLSALALLMGPGSIARVLAADTERVSLAFPFDVVSWDPTARIIPQATSLYKCVFDQPLQYDERNQLAGGVVSAYQWTDDSGLELALDFRDDVYFHNGDKLTSEDFKYTFEERLKADQSLQLGFIWSGIERIETPSPTRAVIHFSKPFVTAPQYLGFAGSFILPKRYIEQVGMEAFLAKPIGSGPYKLVEYQRNNRVVLEAFDRYWGGIPTLREVSIQIIPNPTSRVSALQSGQVAFSYALPIRDALRLGDMPNLTSALTVTVDTYLIHMLDKAPLDDINVRLAMHHAIDKEVLSRALLDGDPQPLSMPSPPGTPAHDEHFSMAFDAQKARDYLARSGYSLSNPVRFKFFATNGVHPVDNQMARAIVQMWSKVGIQAELETIDMGKYFQSVAAGTLEGPALWLWNNSTADPELYSGSYLNADTVFSVWRSEDVMERLRPLLVERDYANRIAGYQAFERWAVEQGYSLPLLQGVSSVAHTTALRYQPFQNGWMLPSRWHV
ncbi:ABC transporter substrate-binding protein [Pseudomonas lopnurensis]|uniref:ABC transporter substrate-binding protein n=1 Tax=Pseudomonas lopnurensis TaxID=1477517 RepID=UPI00187AB920|nr:ABC transporter substrate-binding protein [Pseudomonas lopnurensis]MBE7375697.1 ABC transporter substrate-binding protein [Pseudomonas lopnurensis]